jgi:hypothetical protein
VTRAPAAVVTARTEAVLARDDIETAYRTALTRNLALYRTMQDPGPD